MSSIRRANGGTLETAQAIAGNESPRTTRLHDRTSDEIKKNQERDPIFLFKESLKEAKVFDEKDFEEIEKRAKEATQKAIDFAEQSPFPDEKELFTDVLA